ncbi:MAG: ATP-dependent sacrificial sulfur transferase LarE [Oligoflexia bacterium]|nr:ATP-dependent sacrificial sulfur transferase LarE [Oligoflexia bacterium]
MNTKSYTSKYQKLQEIINSYPSAAVAFSGGTDSTFLLKVASDVLTKNLIAITVSSPSLSRKEFDQAVTLAKQIGVKQIILKSPDIDVEEVKNSSPKRCYFCKLNVFSKIKKEAATHNIFNIFDGSNIDDLSDYRPGMQALKELEIIQPLQQAQFTKNEIRLLSKDLGLATWNKPALACLYTRFPYGEMVTLEKLSMIEEAEEYLHELGFSQLRVRHHGQIARLEIEGSEMENIFSIDLMNTISQKLKTLGFQFVALDLDGYSMGKMNQSIINQY